PTCVGCCSTVTSSALFRNVNANPQRHPLCDETRWRCGLLNHLPRPIITKTNTKEHQMSTSCLDYKLTRRSLLAAGGATLLGLSVPQLLAAAGKSHAAKAEHVILFWNGGGMSHIDTWDPKPGRETGGELGAIKTSVPGIHIGEIFPKVAQQMQHA